MLRRRNVNTADTKSVDETAVKQVKSVESHAKITGINSGESNDVVAVAGTYWLTRILLLRYVAFIYSKSSVLCCLSIT